MRRASARSLTLVVVALAIAACARDATAPRTAAPPASLVVGQPWGPETPFFNLEAVLRAPDGSDGFGLVKFRQPNDATQIVELDVWVRDLSPNTRYLLQRATDTMMDGDCTGVNWLTLGRGAMPQAITTDERGTGRASLFRDLAAFPVGSTFDIHFRVVEATTGAVVLSSGCYQFTVSQ